MILLKEKVVLQNMHFQNDIFNEISTILTSIVVTNLKVQLSDFIFTVYKLTP